MRQNGTTGLARVSFALAVAIVLGACASAEVDTRLAPAPATASLPPHRLAGSEIGGKIDLAVGQLLEVAVGSNASTGYGWERIDAGNGVLVEAPGEYVSDDNPNRMVGVGGTMIHRYRVARAGEETLQLVYRRSWEKDVPPVETVSVTVHAQ